MARKRTLSTLDTSIEYEYMVSSPFASVRGIFWVQPENRGIYTQSDSPKKSSRNIWSLAVVSVDQRY